MQQVIQFCNAQDTQIRLLIFILSLFPALLLLWDASFDLLGFNPFEALITRSGFWAMWFLIATLLITPLRRWLRFLSASLNLTYGKRLADWNFLIKSRRMLGLYSFFYLSLHFGIYLNLEAGWQLSWFLEDSIQRPFLNLGLAAWVISFALAMTSPMRIRRKMGKHWRRLHRLIYLLALLALVHIGLEEKAGENSFLPYVVIVLVLLLHRILTAWVKRWHRADDNGLAAKR